MQEYDIVDYRGQVNRDGISQILQESFAGMCTLLPYGQYHKADNFATKVYEYMAARIPTIHFDSKYARKINDKYNFGMLVDPADVLEISQAINYLRDNPEKSRQIGESAYKVVYELFNWEVEEKKLIALYKDLLK